MPKNSDDDVWEAFSASIKPIHKRKKAPELPEVKLPRRFASASLPPDFKPMPPLHIADKSNVDGRSYDNLRKGEMKIDARLDLHGKSKTQAFHLLSEFVKKTAADGKRCILIITGKGRPEATGNTLREALPDWLNHPEIRPFILTYTQAASSLGGSGAYTILLKRKR